MGMATTAAEYLIVRWAAAKREADRPHPTPREAQSAQERLGIVEAALEGFASVVEQVVNAKLNEETCRRLDEAARARDMHGCPRCGLKHTGEFDHCPACRRALMVDLESAIATVRQYREAP